MTDAVIYDPTTDSMYITLREEPTAHTICHDDRDFAVDVGEDGEPVGFDIQFASQHPDVIAEALKSLRRHVAMAA